MVFLPLLIFTFGIIIGSFLNVVILRLNTGRSIVQGRSKCSRCDRPLVWHELIPVLSFLALRGKCRTCRAPLSFQYPFVELLTGIMFVLLYTKIILGGGFGLTQWLVLLFAMKVTSFLIVITVYDIRHKIIPNIMVYPFIAMGLVAVVWNIFTGAGAPLSLILAGPTLAAPFFLLWFFSQGRAMGFGDVKLALGIGWLVGGVASGAVFLLSFWIGAIVGLLLLAASKVHSMKSEVPFAPFLIVSLFIVWYWNLSILSLFPLW